MIAETFSPFIRFSLTTSAFTTQYLCAILARLKRMNSYKFDFNFLLNAKHFRFR